MEEREEELRAILTFDDPFPSGSGSYVWIDSRIVQTSDGPGCFVPAQPIDHLRTTAGLNAKTSGWARLEGQAVAGALSRGNCGGAAFEVQLKFAAD